MHIEVGTDGYQPSRGGLYLLYGLVVFLFLLFVLRFWYLQMLHGEDYTRLSHANRTRQERVYATRGIILDLKGRLLAENRPAYCLALIREDCPDIPATLAQVSEWTDTPLAHLQAKFHQDARQVQSFEPQIIATDIPFEQIADIEQQLYQWPGLSVEIRQRRYYPLGPLFAHVLGYVAEANEKELKANEEELKDKSEAERAKYKLVPGDIVGKLGLELTKEKTLRGIKGSNIVEVDVHGRQLNRQREQPPQAGANLTLSLDIDLQQAASDALGDEAGAIVVMEPDTGKLRALVTHPSYDTNAFTAKLSKKDWAALVDNPRHPLQNRAIQSVYPPGSVWKLVMAGLLLEQKISPQATVTCSGQVTLGTHVFRCWKKGGHGAVNMLRSLVESCDVYYYEMGQKVGIDNIERFAKAAGFGCLTGIDLPHERSGLVPSRSWKLERFKEPWQRGETLNVSIGQGYTLVTPVQMAVFVSSLLNGGERLKPSLIENEPKEVKGTIPLTASQRNFILEGMHVTASTGTAKRINRPDAVMGGKTGTAQVVRIGEVRLKKHEMAYLHRDHAWIASWGMKDGKTYVVITMVEHGGGGGAVAGPITAKVYDALFGPVPSSPVSPPEPGFLQESRSPAEAPAREAPRRRGGASAREDAAPAAAGASAPPRQDARAAAPAGGRP